MARVLVIQKINFNDRIQHIEKIGIAQISAVLKKNNHTCDLFLVDEDYKKMIDYIKSFNPDVIAFSITTLEVESYLKIASEIKKNNIKSLIITGGPHPSFNPDFIENKYIDIINIGEGEYSTLELADAIDDKKDITTIKNLYVKKDGRIYKNEVRPLVDLDELPAPDRDIYLKYKIFRKQKEYDFVLSRGCPYNCNFCFIHQWKAIYKNDKKKNRSRLRSVDKSIEEIKILSEKTKISLVVFGDSTFYTNKKWTIDFLKEYAEKISIPFTINLRADDVNEELVKALYGTNCCQSVRVAVEVGSERIRNEVLNKKVTNQKIYDAINLLREYKIKIMVYIMFGLPDETLKDAFETIEMIQKIKPDLLKTAVFHPYPGLGLTNYAIKKGYLDENRLKKYNGNSKYSMFNSLLKQPEIDEVMNLLKLSSIVINFSILNPAIKKLVKLRPNVFFDFIYLSKFLKLLVFY